MQAQCREIAPLMSLEVEVEPVSRPVRAFVRFSNGSPIPVGFPIEQEPAYRPDESAGQVTIWFGYFDEVYGPYRARYVLPALQVVPPGGEVRVEITSPDLAGRLTDQRASLRLLARVATRDLAQDRTRGSQPLDDYLRHSCEIQSRPHVGGRGDAPTRSGN